jgi:4'-phosphopantetheinyl transferase
MAQPTFIASNPYACKGSLCHLLCALTGPKIRWLKKSTFFNKAVFSQNMSPLTQFLWPEQPSFPDLGKNDIHLWWSPLDLPADLQQRISSHLSAEETSRAARLTLPLVKRHFTAAHGILREILAGYLQVEPASPQILQHPGGKPYLSDPAARPLHFSLSHSHGWLLAALSRYAPLGVDLEKVRPIQNARLILQNWFSVQEVQEFETCETSEKLTLFFRLWVRREAAIKARGTGLALSSSSDDLFTGLQLADLPALPGFAAALAVTNPSAARAHRTTWADLEGLKVFDPILRAFDSNPSINSLPLPL